MSDSGAINDGGVGGVFNRLRGSKAKIALDPTAIKELNEQLGTLKENLSDIRQQLAQIKTVGDVFSGMGGAGGTYGGYVKVSKPRKTKPSGDSSVDEDVSGDNTGTPRTKYYIHDPHGGGSGNLRSFLPSIGRSVIARSIEDAYGSFATSMEGKEGYGAALRGGLSAARAALSKGGGLGLAGVGAIGSEILTSVGQQIGGALDARVDRGYAYSLSADKLSVMYQQMTGMSQRQVMNSYRRPLSNYRLGQGGINDLMAMQAQTGLSALIQAGSAESIRTMNGYGYSTQDAAQMIGSLADPATVNRMFMMTGTALYGIGGKENSAMSVIQRVAGMINVNSEQRAREALAPGSMTRSRLASMGLSDELQTQVIQYAAQNAQFHNKGGSGNYDPTNDAHRQRMGIEENFATQAEETIRQQMGREENFYSRQADNFADLERMTQTLTRAFGALEDQLSGLIGAKISTNPAAKIIGKTGSAIGMGLMAGGLALAPETWGLSLIATAAGALMSFGGGFLGGGDAPVTGKTAHSRSVKGSSKSIPIDPNMRIPGAGGTVGGLMKLDTFSNMQPVLKDRVLNVIMAGGGRVGIDNGWRSKTQQANMFFSRYHRTNRTDKSTQLNKSDRWYDGVWWEKNSPGIWDTAPPGNSFHEIGLAVDFAGDLQLASDLGKQFGLYTFENTSTRELHHAQPVETPTSWQEYVNGGAKFGLGDSTSFTSSGSEPPGSGSDMSSYGSSYGTPDTMEARTLPSLAGMSLSEMISSAGSMASAIGSTSSFIGGTSSSSGVDFGDSTYTKSASGALSGKELVRLLKKVGGLTGEDLAKGVGISWRESRWIPSTHTKVNKDDSYGLFQINMLDKPGYMMGEERRKRWGLTSNDQLLDPITNIKAMKSLKDGSGWQPWRPGGDLPETTGVDMSWAAQVVRAAERNKPIPPSPKGGGDAPVNGSAVKPRSSVSSAAYQAAASNSQTSLMMASQEYNVTISPTIHISGNAGQGELNRMAKEIGKLLEKEAKHILMRES